MTNTTLKPLDAAERADLRAEKKAALAAMKRLGMDIAEGMMALNAGDDRCPAFRDYVHNILRASLSAERSIGARVRRERVRQKGEGA